MWIEVGHRGFMFVLEYVLSLSKERGRITPSYYRLSLGPGRTAIVVQ
jgi:hypothetical protein